MIPRGVKLLMPNRTSRGNEEERDERRRTWDGRVVCDFRKKLSASLDTLLGFIVLSFRFSSLLLFYTLDAREMDHLTVCSLKGRKNRRGDETRAMGSSSFMYEETKHCDVCVNRNKISAA